LIPGIKGFFGIVDMEKEEIESIYFPEFFKLKISVNSIIVLHKTSHIVLSKPLWKR
jgi:hypothetical protein